jgi:enterochelin esterase-like enzyme
MKKQIFISLLTITMASALYAQQARVNVEWAPFKKGDNAAAWSARVNSPEVADDHTVIFRLYAPEAKKVSVSGDMFRPPMTIRSLDMVKDTSGVWSVKAGPFQPELYRYTFNVDGMSIMDPSNTYVSQANMPLSSLLYVHDSGPSFFDAKTDVAHGSVTAHYYYSEVTKGIRNLYVYTPPDYDPKKQYPVLYLMGGSGEVGETWWLSFNINFIMDNLLAEKKAVPMLIVLVNNQMVHRGAPNHTAIAFPLLEEEYLKCVIPFVEAKYNVIKNKHGRAICGLSMGGRQTQYIGLRNTDVFGSLGILSAAIQEGDIKALNITDNVVLLKDKSVNNLVDYLFLGAGPDETNAQARHQILHEQCDQYGIKHQYVIRGAAHNFITWTELLYNDFLPGLWRTNFVN